MHYPLTDVNTKPRYRHYLDSLAMRYPQLLNANYYFSLMDKALAFNDVPFAYKMKRLPISKKTFYNLVHFINQSGFWHLLYRDSCSDIPMDSGAYILEAITPGKYNVATSPECVDSSSALYRFCKVLMKYADI